MENEAQQQAEQQAQAGETAEPEEKDYKALYEEAVRESRKWEKRSKENLAQLNDLKGSKSEPDPTIEERIAALEKENGDHSYSPRVHNYKLNSAGHAAYYR